MSSSIYIDKQIYVFAGRILSSGNMRSNQRIEMTEEENIERVTVFGEHNVNFYFPILYHAQKDFCLVN